MGVIMPRLTIWDLADPCGNVTVADVARSYGVHGDTVRKWIDAGLLPVKRIPSGRRIIIKADDVERFDRIQLHSSSHISSV